MAELEELKKVLRSLVVSSPTQMDMRALLKDYRNIMGEAVPIAKYGYRNAYDFLKERCSDCFLLHGPSSNPVLTLIVPDSLKHIDQHVQKQRNSSGTKGKCKRRSVPVAAIKPQEYRVKPQSMNRPPQQIYNTQNGYNNYASDIPPRFRPRTLEEPNKQNNNKYPPREPERTGLRAAPTLLEHVRPVASCDEILKEQAPCPDDNVIKMPSDKGSGEIGRVERLLKMKMSYLALAEGGSGPGDDDDSGRHTASSGCSLGNRKTSLDEVNEQIGALVSQHPEGLWTTDLVRLYRAMHGREVPWARLGHRSLTALLVALPAVRVARPPAAGDWRLTPACAPAAPAPAPTAHATAGSGGGGGGGGGAAARPAERAERDDALPGLDFEEGVFPWDCVQWAESIPRADVSALLPGDMVPVCVAEVYSPAHCWLQMLADRAKLYSLMDACNEYYGSGAGRTRVLCPGAARAGHYCAALFEGEWHRAVVLRAHRDPAQPITVRHVDYGTVTRASRSALRPLLRQFAALPQQAVRCRLAGIRPSGERGARYSLAAATRLLELVRDKALVANVCAVDYQERIVEAVLVDTAAAEDVDVGAELVRSGHAARRADVALLSGECESSPSGSRSGSAEVDVRSLLADMTALTALAPRAANSHAADGADADGDGADADGASEVSASASEVVGRSPRRMKPWACEERGAATQLQLLHRHLKGEATHYRRDGHTAGAVMQRRLASLRDGARSSHDTTTASPTDDGSSSDDSVLSVASVVMKKRLESARKANRPKVDSDADERGSNVGSVLKSRINKAKARSPAVVGGASELEPTTRAHHQGHHQEHIEQHLEADTSSSGDSVLSLSSAVLRHRIAKLTAKIVK